MYTIQRQSKILELLEQQGQVDVHTLADDFASSRETIRRDLREMEASGLLKRTHGGAVSLTNGFSQGYEYPLFAREIQKYEEKQSICRAAAKLLEDGDTIFLDNSSTTMRFLHYVPANIRVTAVTNSIQVLLEAGKLNNNNVNVVSLGGALNVKNYSVTGLLTNRLSRLFFPDKAIMSCRGITAKAGMTDASFLEVEVKRIMIDQSKQLILLADHTKFGLTGAIHIGALDEIDTIVTDSKVSAEKLKLFENSQTRIIIGE